MFFRSIAVGLAMLAMTPALAQDAEDATPRTASEIPDPVVSVTRHRGTFGGQSISYTATAGETYLTDDDGKPNAEKLHPP